MEVIAERQKYIYNYIVNKGSLETTAEELIFGWNAQGKGAEYIIKDRAHDKCVALRNDIDKINLDFSKEKVIYIKGDYTYKVAETKDEIKDMLDRMYYKTALNKLYKASRVLAKAKRDKQIPLFDVETLQVNADRCLNVLEKEGQQQCE